MQPGLSDRCPATEHSKWHSQRGATAASFQPRFKPTVNGWEYL